MQRKHLGVDDDCGSASQKRLVGDSHLAALVIMTMLRTSGLRNCNRLAFRIPDTESRQVPVIQNDIEAGDQDQCNHGGKENAESERNRHGYDHLGGGVVFQQDRQ